MKKKKENSNSSDFESTQVLSLGSSEKKKHSKEKIPSLIVLEGIDAGKILKLTSQTMSLGRDKRTDICFNDIAISRKHCLFRNAPSNTTLIDLQSSNGTLVNGKKISKKRLNQGDKITVGKTILKFDLTDADESEYHEKLYKLITFDDLTSLYNRKNMLKQLDILTISIPKSLPFSLLFIDIDHFKRVNDTFDHITGSEVLSEFGRLLLSNLRVGDIPCRYGGEEFVVILPRTKSDNAVFVAEKIRKIIESHVFYTRTGEYIVITVSIGVAEASTSLSNPKELLIRSDESMYCAKEHGRNLTVLYREEKKPHFVPIN